MTRLKNYFKTNWQITILTILFFVSYSVWTVTRHNFFQTDAVDLGIFDQVIWKYSQFKEPLSTVKFSTYPGVNILGDHFHPLIAILSPLFWVWNDVRILLVAQSLLVTVAVYPLYRLALLKTKSKLFAFSIGFSYLAFTGLQTLLEYDFHEIALALPLLAWALYLLEVRKYRWFFVAAVLSMLVKEDMPLVLAFVGIWALIKHRSYKVGVATIVMSMLFYLGITKVLIPYFKGAAFDYEHLNPELGITTEDLLKTAVSNPFLVIKTAFYDGDWIKAKTMLNLFSSYSFLPLLSPTTLILLVPNIVSRFLTDLPQRWIIRFQYSAIWDPILATATIYGLLNLLGMLKKFDKYRTHLLSVVSVFLIVAPVIATYRLNGPLTHRIFDPNFYTSQERYEKNYTMLSKIPSDASVMAQSAFVPHLTHRDEIYRYDDTIFNKKIFPEYIIMSADEHSDPPYVLEDLQKRIDTLRENPNYQALFWDGARLLLKKND